jgi:hypothetical protein
MKREAGGRLKGGTGTGAGHAGAIENMRRQAAGIKVRQIIAFDPSNKKREDNQTRQQEIS